MTPETYPAVVHNPGFHVHSIRRRGWICHWTRGESIAAAEPHSSVVSEIGWDQSGKCWIRRTTVHLWPFLVTHWVTLDNLLYLFKS
jgi:hypothetical protein